MGVERRGDHEGGRKGGMMIRKDDLNTCYCVDARADPPSSAASGMDFENRLVLHYGRDGL